MHNPSGVVPLHLNIEFDAPVGFFWDPYTQGPNAMLTTNTGEWPEETGVTTHGADSMPARNSVSLCTFAAWVRKRHWGYLKYLKPLRCQQELHLLYDDHDVQRYGRRSLLAVTNEVIKQVHTKEARELLRAAIPAIEKWVAGTLLQKPGRAARLRVWDQGTRGDILGCFTSDEFADMAGIERWYAPAFRHVLWNYHMMLQQALLPTQPFAGK